MTSQIPVIPIHVLDKTVPKGLPFSVAPIGQLRSGFKFADEQGNAGVALDYTMTSNFQTCPLLFMEAYVKGITPKRKQMHLHFGSACHLGWAAWYRTHDVEAAVSAFLSDYVDPEGEELKTRRNGEALMRAYAERYPSESWEVLEIETPIVFEFGPGMFHFVIPDMVVKDHGRIYGVEHKHTKSIGINYFKQFKPNQQLDGQVAGIRAKWGMCDGIIVNPTEIQKGGRMGRPSPYFGFGPRDISSRTQEDIEWWRRDMVEVYRDINETIGRGYYRANRSACHNYAGCAFRELHINHGDKYIEAEFYEPKDWNPMDRLKERPEGGVE